MVFCFAPFTSNYNFKLANQHHNFATMRRTRIWKTGLSLPPSAVNKFRSARFQEGLKKLRRQDPHDTLILQLGNERSGGSLAPVVDFMVRGNQIPMLTGVRIVKKAQSLKDALQYQIAGARFFGASSLGQVSVQIDGLGNLKNVNMKKAIADLPREQQFYFIASAHGDALSKARAFAYEEVAKISDTSFQELYDALEAYHESRLLDGTSISGGDGALAASGTLPVLTTGVDYTAAKIDLVNEVDEDPYEFLTDNIPEYELPEAIEVDQETTNWDEDNEPQEITGDIWDGTVEGPMSIPIEDYYRTRVLLDEMPRMMLLQQLENKKFDKSSSSLADEESSSEFNKLMNEWSNHTKVVTQHIADGKFCSAVRHLKRTSPVPLSPLQRQMDWYSWLFQLRKNLGGFEESSITVDKD